MCRTFASYRALYMIKNINVDYEEPQLSIVKLLLWYMFNSILVIDVMIEKLMQLLTKYNMICYVIYTHNFHKFPRTALLKDTLSCSAYHEISLASIIKLTENISQISAKLLRLYTFQCLYSGTPVRLVRYFHKWHSFLASLLKWYLSTCAGKKFSPVL